MTNEEICLPEKGGYDTNIGRTAFEAANVTEPFHFEALYFLKFKSD